MDMWMRGHIPGPGVQDPSHADLSAQVCGVQGEGFQGGRGGLKEQVVQEVLVRAGQGPQSDTVRSPPWPPGGFWAYGLRMWRDTPVHGAGRCPLARSWQNSP